MAEQHAVSGGEGQGVAGALLPGEVARPVHDLTALNAGELAEGAVRGLVAPDALGGRVHGVAAVALLVVAVILVAVNHDLVADLEALDLPADRPHHAGGVRTGDVIRRLVIVEGRDRPAQGRPDAVVIDARRHHQNQHLVGADARRFDDLELHGLLGLAMALLADRPGERRNFPNLIKVLQGGGGGGLAHPCGSLQIIGGSPPSAPRAGARRILVVFRRNPVDHRTGAH